VPWTIDVHEAAAAEIAALPLDLQARLDRFIAIIAEHGPQQLPPKAFEHIAAGLWELRIKGKDNIARAFYVTRIAQRLVIVRVFVKKTQKTPPREIKLAQRRAKDV